MSAGRKRLRVGLVVPPGGANRERGIRIALDSLGCGLTGRGHEVVLFTAPTDPTTEQLLHPSFGPLDADRLTRAAAALRRDAGLDEELSQCDIIHDHTMAGLFFRYRHHGVPIVVTNHGLFNTDLVDLYRRAGSRVPVVAVSNDHASRAPRSVKVADVIHHGVNISRYDFASRGGDYIVTFGRLEPMGGIDAAIDIARHVGMPLRIAAGGPQPSERDYFDHVIAPKLGRDIEYLDEPGHRELVGILGGARALLNPITWPHPFGLSMIEAMACGTPVIASSAGAAPELIDAELTGFIADNFDEFVSALNRIDDISRERCREHVEQHFTMDHMARNHERLYHTIIERRSERSKVVDLASHPLAGSNLATKPRPFPSTLPAI